MSFNTEFKTIILKVQQDGIAIITLNRPQQLNSFTDEMSQELVTAFQLIDSEDSIRVGVVTGAGRSFCAGASLQVDTFQFAKRSEKLQLQSHRDQGGQVALSIFNCRKPIIAAINGSAVGIGITMTLPMDIRVVAEDARVGFVFARRGIVMEACSSWFLPRLVGIGKASELVLTGRVFLAKDEASSGLFNYVVPKDQVLPKALQLAKEISENTSATSTAINKGLLNHPQKDPQSTHLIDSKWIFWSGQQPDAIEGVMSFLEKRKSNFTMKVSTDLPDFYPWWKEPKVEINGGSKL